jgi:hypothetical protein
MVFDANIMAKCKFGSPLLNTAGSELYCGPGLQYSPCPAGSECILGACCALAGSASFAITVPMPTVSASETTSDQSQNQWTNQGNQGNQWTNQGNQGKGTTGATNDQSQNQGTTDQNQGKGTAGATKGTEAADHEYSDEFAAVGSDDTVRFLNIRLLQPSEALAMWAPPNGTQPTSYTAELSYDGQEWRRLNLEEPDSTFIMFPVTEQKDFQVRVTPEGGAPAMETHKNA